MFFQNQSAVLPIVRRARLIVRSLGLATAVALAIVSSARAQSPAAQATTTAKTPTPAAQATPTAPQAPTVALEVVPDRDAVERQQTVAVVVIVTNKSDASLTGVTVSVPSAAFKPAVAVTFPADVSPFGTAHATITLQPEAQAAFGAHKVAVVAEYSWAGPAGARRSAQTATVSLQIKRRFEEEAKGLPGGTAAFLYLLLPVVPAFLAFDVVDRLRKGETLRMPTFSTEHIVPAFLLSLLFSIGFMTAASFNVELAYSDPGLFLRVLALSAALGAGVPCVRWLYAVVVRWRWAFTNDDTPAEYLRKALLGPRAPSDYVWIEGTVGSETWEGVRLRQPDDTLVLGVRLQATAATGAGGTVREDVWTTLTTEIFEQTALKDRRLLVKLVKTGAVGLRFQQKIIRGGQPIDGAVAVDGLAGLKETSGKSTPKPLVEPVR
ncbi:MAG: hypothetical protein HY616_06045 [Candidatus Rokubacteria bacterium]|nr:hypothetical protein [Candidatus Rokubacteria bacterium]MBI4254616.1 hypothetical protein [Candidatus Rokubacteria bacterium]